jgi:cytochrome c peroxidase
MSAAAIRGEILFQGKGACAGCHRGPLFTDNGIHNTLVPQRNGWNDPGAPAPPGGFNTPTLRDIRNTAPYMHNGVFNTLREVVEFYNARSSIAPLNLTPQEMDDLVAYMNAL